MVRTRLLYLEDSYLRTVSAMVTESFEGGVTLDQTIFYPEGGGQPTDTGRLDSELGTSLVTRVAKKGNRVLHHLRGPVPPVGGEVFLRLDWPRRYAHMRMHTAQHLVSRIVFDRFGARTVANQIQAESSSIDFSPATLQESDLPSVEEEANRLIRQGLPITFEVVNRSMLGQLVGQDRSDLSRLPRSLKEVRLVRIGDYDVYPCAGTHVASTSELVELRITDWKRKGEDTVSISYKLAPPT